MSVMSSLAEKYKMKTKDTKNLKVELQSEILSIFQEMPMINRIMVYGYTPGFNDGDICRHSGYVSVDGWEESGYESERWITDNGKVFYRDETDDEDSEYTSSTFKTECVQVAEIVAGMEATIIQDIYESNYALVWRREADGKIVFSNNYYDCGY